MGTLLPFRTGGPKSHTAVFQNLLFNGGKPTTEFQNLLIRLAVLDGLRRDCVQHSEEKLENEATIKEAEEGKEAVNMAIDILSKFYYYYYYYYCYYYYYYFY